MFTAVSFYNLTIAQNINIEFADWHLMQKYYEIILEWLPLAILLTLFGTIKRKNSKVKNIVVAIATITASIFSFFAIVGTMFSIGFGAWIDESILYQDRKNNKLLLRSKDLTKVHLDMAVLEL
jgi:hypothetical protein